MNLFLSAKQPLVVGHRGACAYAPENTLASFRLAAEQGADAVELDAKLSADGVVMVIHDPTVDRTTDGKGRVNMLSLGQLKALDAGSFFAPAFAGEPIPTLEEVFDSVGRQVLINVELTNYASPMDDLVAKVVALVRNFHLEERVIFSSFHPLNLARAGKLLPEVPRAMLADVGRPGWWARSSWMRLVAPQAVNPYFSDANAAFLARQRALKRKVFVWTVNDPSEMERLAREAVAGIITDDPPAALKAVHAARAW